MQRRIRVHEEEILPAPSSPQSISTPKSSQSAARGTFLVHQCARTCIYLRCCVRKLLYLNAIHLAPNVHKKKRVRLV